MKPQNERIKLIYYTDPLCSTCWVFEPYLLRFLMTYNSYVSVEFSMGGLLESWDRMERIDIRYDNRSFLKSLWQSESKRFGACIDASIWENGTVETSYLACRAYYAALLESENKARHLLHNFREFLFICGKDLSSKAAITTCAIDAGLDMQLFNEHMDNGEAQDLFERALEKKKAHGVKHFPSLILENASGEQRKILNINDSKLFENVLDKLEKYILELLPDLKLRGDAQFSVNEILQHVNRLSFRQFLVVTGKREFDLRNDLIAAYDRGELIREELGGFEYFRLNETPYLIKQTNRKEKFAIIGGGICGGFLKFSMEKLGFDSTLFERYHNFENKGFGFLILKNGMDALEAFGFRNQILKYGNHMNLFRAITPNGDTLYTKHLEYCIAIGRDHLHELFQSNIGAENINFGKEFTGFEEHAYSKSVVFSDGTYCQADAYLATDGFRSLVRDSLFPGCVLEPVGEREIVCIVETDDLPFVKDEFLKIVDVNAGKAMGIIPLSDTTFVWFLQFNHNLDPIQEKDPEALKSYVLRSIEQFPAHAVELVRRSDFETAFLWISQRMNHIASYHSDNVLLMGDAAHPLIPLTSQGANSALADVAQLLSILTNDNGDASMTQLFQEYENKRRDIIDFYINDGDQLVSEFLNLPNTKMYTLPLTIH
ncbi:MAG: DsbA family protein [Cryomorphaceae bacterium]|nr:DsbA family protein [Cryomorphaceae bacterium]